ncbi:unnamed protein product [Caenorhabditis brenneri]
MMRKVNIFLSCLLFIIPMCSCSAGTAHVQGQLLCRGKPAVGEKIELWEKNFGLPDTLIVSEVTDNNGRFLLKGTISELIGQPIMYVYFINYCAPSTTTWFMTCGDSIKIYVPKEFIADGHLPKNIFHLDNLEVSNAKTEQVGLERITHSIFSHTECHR